MKIKLDSSNRKFIDVEVELDGKNIKFTYFEKNTRQIDEMKDLAKKNSTKMYHIDDLARKQFLDNLHGSSEDKEALEEFYQEHGNFSDFINMCDEELGKLKKKA
jgi:organic radical activating enzyme